MKWQGLLLLAACGSSAPKSAPPPSGAPETPVAHRADPTSAPIESEGALGETARTAGGAGRCASIPSSEVSVDGLLDEWNQPRNNNSVVAHAGAEPDGAVFVHCGWDGKVLTLALDIRDDRVIRVKGGTEDHVTIKLGAGARPLAIVVFPGNNLGKSKITKPARVEAADSLQPKGFSVEVAVPATAIPDVSSSTASLALDVVFSDSDAATGGDTTPITIHQSIDLADRKDLFDDFLATVKLAKSDIKFDVTAELDPDRKGKERVVAGGTVIGVLTDQYAYVTVPAQTAEDVKKVELIPLGPRDQQIISAVVRQSGNGGARELLMLWTVWSGQLQPLAQIEVRKEMGNNVLSTKWHVVKGKKGPELWLEPEPAVGWTAETWNEIPAEDLDPILLPWDAKRGGIAYTLTGAEVARRDLPPAKKRKR